MTTCLPISLRGVSKMYRLYASLQDRVREVFHPFQKKYHREFWALRDIDLEIEQGTTVGVVGRNGSGKSTLLQIMAGVLKPTAGEVFVEGRVSPLLELGAGFDPEFTGRENVMFSGSLMGFDEKQMSERLHDIEAFADIGQFIDQPVKVYSSGMFARLAFATAVHVDPDILIIDEVLAVGDARFQHKCFLKFREFQQAGKTILFVTHDVNKVLQHCDRAVFLEGGRILEDGKPKNVVDAYLDLVLTGTLATDEHRGRMAEVSNASEEEASTEAQATVQDLDQFLRHTYENDQCPQRPNYNQEEYRLGDSRATILDYRLVVDNRIDPPSIPWGTNTDIYMKATFHETVETPMFGISLKTVDGVMVTGTNTRFTKLDLRPVHAGETVVFKFTLQLNLQPGDYFVDLGVAEKLPDQDRLLDVRNSLIHLHIEYIKTFTGFSDLSQFAEEIVRLTPASHTVEKNG
ncbi:ABC transporter ATP-binding protein [Nitrospina gracilis]|nr:ABC transporter ATP-binding protein [Nitrospina gracilis]